MMGYVTACRMLLVRKRPQEDEQFADDDHWLGRGWGRREALVREVWSTVLILVLGEELDFLKMSWSSHLYTKD